FNVAAVGYRGRHPSKKIGKLFGSKLQCGRGWLPRKTLETPPIARWVDAGLQCGRGWLPRKTGQQVEGDHSRKGFNVAAVGYRGRPPGKSTSARACPCFNVAAVGYRGRLFMWAWIVAAALGLQCG